MYTCTTYALAACSCWLTALVTLVYRAWAWVLLVTALMNDETAVLLIAALLRLPEAAKPAM